MLSLAQFLVSFRLDPLKDAQQRTLAVRNGVLYSFGDPIAKYNSAVNRIVIAPPPASPNGQNRYQRTHWEELQKEIPYAVELPTLSANLIETKIYYNDKLIQAQTEAEYTELTNKLNRALYYFTEINEPELVFPAIQQGEPLTEPDKLDKQIYSSPETLLYAYFKDPYAFHTTRTGTLRSQDQSPVLTYRGLVIAKAVSRGRFEILPPFHPHAATQAILDQLYAYSPATRGTRLLRPIITYPDQPPASPSTITDRWIYILNSLEQAIMQFTRITSAARRYGWRYAVCRRAAKIAGYNHVPDPSALIQLKRVGANRFTIANSPVTQLH